MKIIVIISMLFILFNSSYAQRKTKNVILISMDGYRWKELLSGADSVLLSAKKYNSQDSTERFTKYWADRIF